MRKPQVGDVYEYEWGPAWTITYIEGSLIFYRIIFYCIWYQLGPIREPDTIYIYENNDYLKKYAVTNLFSYKGKIAPRYKRLFWIYFIPDVKND